MLGIAWDAAVIEYQARWHREWSDLDFDGSQCQVRTSPVGGSNNLFDVIGPWIALEGTSGDWWTSELIPGKTPREPTPEDLEL